VSVPTARPSAQSTEYLALWWRRAVGGVDLICATGGGHFVRRLQQKLIEDGYGERLSSLSPSAIVLRGQTASALGLGVDTTRRTLTADGAWGANTQFALFWAAKANNAPADVLEALANDFRRRAISLVSMRYAALVAYHPNADWDDVEFALTTVVPGWGQTLSVPGYDAALRCWNPETGDPPPDPRGSRRGSSSITRSTSSQGAMASYGDTNATGVLAWVERHPVATTGIVLATAAATVAAVNAAMKANRRKKAKR
jgi:hypothetical protein